MAVQMASCSSTGSGHCHQVKSWALECVDKMLFIASQLEWGKIPNHFLYLPARWSFYYPSSGSLTQPCCQTFIAVTCKSLFILVESCVLIFLRFMMCDMIFVGYKVLPRNPIVCQLPENEILIHQGTCLCSNTNKVAIFFPEVVELLGTRSIFLDKTKTMKQKIGNKNIINFPVIEISIVWGYGAGREEKTFHMFKNLYLNPLP